MRFILQESMAGREDDTACRVAQEKMIEQFGQFIEVIKHGLWLGFIGLTLRAVLCQVPERTFLEYFFAIDIIREPSIARSWDPGSEEVETKGGNGRAREGESVEKCCCCLKNDLKES